MVAVITPLKDAFPTTKIRGCAFYFSQSIWRNVSRLGLIREYKKNQFIFRMFLQLAFVPYNNVKLEFNKIVTWIINENKY